MSETKRPDRDRSRLKLSVALGGQRFEATGAADTVSRNYMEWLDGIRKLSAIEPFPALSLNTPTDPPPSQPPPRREEDAK